MPERSYTVLHDSARVKVIRWSGLLNGDTGEPYPLASRFSKKTIQLTGTFGTGGTLLLEGSLDVSTPSWFTLTDLDSVQLSLTSAGIRMVRESTYQIRPRVSAGDSNTNLTVTMLLLA